MRVDSAGDKCESFALDLQDGRPQAVCGHAGTVFVIYPDRVDLFESAGGSKIESTPIPTGLLWRRDRFFSSPTQWYALSFDGFKPVFEPLLSKDLRPRPGRSWLLLTCPTSKGQSASWMTAVSSAPATTENVVHHGLDWPRAIGGHLALGERCGHLRRSRQEPPRSFAVVTAAWRTVYGDPQRWLDHHPADLEDRPAAGRAEPVLQDLRRFPRAAGAGFPQVRVGDFPGNQPASGHGKPAGGYPRQAGRGHVQSLARAARRRLFVATSPNGRTAACAWLDSRGMLHLKSSDQFDSRSDARASRRRPGGLDLRGPDLRHGYFAGETRPDTEADVQHNMLQLAHVLAAAPLPAATEADVYQNILQRFVALTVMITLPLRMRYGEKPLRQAAAWLIPGAEPRTWLDEMLAWGVPLGDAVLYRIPRSARDLSPQGVLVVLPAGLVAAGHASQPGLCGRWSPAFRRHAGAVVRPLGEIPSNFRLKAGLQRPSSICPSRPVWIPAASDAEVAELAGDGGRLHPASDPGPHPPGSERSAARG